jgi:hypothetical protein
MSGRHQIHLSGPEGNAFALLSLAGQYGRQLGVSSEEIAEIQRNMKSGDYEHLLAVFANTFGMVVDIIHVDGTKYEVPGTTKIRQ